MIQWLLSSASTYRPCGKRCAMAACCSRLFGGVDFADKITTGLLQNSPSSATRTAEPGRFSNWLAIVRQNFSFTQKVAAIVRSSAGKFQNQGLETDPDSASAYRLITRTKRPAIFVAPEVSRNATKRITPMRHSSAARRDTVAPTSARLRSCSEGGFHSAGATGSTSTTPAVSSGYRAANNGIVSPPKECPTRTYGGAIAARSSKVWSSFTMRSAVRGIGP